MNEDDEDDEDDEEYLPCWSDDTIIRLDIVRPNGSKLRLSRIIVRGLKIKHIEEFVKKEYPGWKPDRFFII